MNKENREQLDTILEGLLFSFGTESTITKLAKITECEKQEVIDALQKLKEFYTTHNRGLTIVTQEDKVQLVTASSVSEFVEAFQKSELEGPLSKSAMETLSIISYKGPITKPEIDTIRGVNSGLMLRSLLIRGIIDRKKSDKDARTFSYSLSLDFLRHLGVTRPEEIPGYKEFHENKVLEKLAESAREVEVALKGDSKAEEKPNETEKVESSEDD